MQRNKINCLIGALLFSAFSMGTLTSLTGCGAVRNAISDPIAPDQKGDQVGTIKVSVVDNTAKPVVGAKVKVFNDKGEQIDGDYETNKEGQAVLEGVPAGQNIKVVATFRGWRGSQGNLGLAAGQETLTSIMITPDAGALGMLQGIVRNGMTGLPVDGASITVGGTPNSIRTQRDGTFKLDDVPAGSPQIILSARGYRENRVAVSVIGEEITKQEFKIYPADANGRLGKLFVTSADGVAEIGNSGYVDKVHRLNATIARPTTGGNLLVGRNNGVSVYSFTSGDIWSFKPFWFWEQVKGPQGIAAGSGTDIIVSDTAKNRILIVGKGRSTKEIKANLLKPAGVERLSQTGTTLVADSGNNRIVELTDTGRIMWQVGDGTPGMLNDPLYAQRLSNGNTLISDTGNNRVLEVDGSGQKLVWSYSGVEGKQNCVSPASAVRLPNGNTLIAETVANRVTEVASVKDKESGAWSHTIVRVWNNVAQPVFADFM
jgi:hypothetical protein